MSNEQYSESAYWPLSKLSLWERNPRSIKEDRFKELKERLKRQGQIKPLLVTKDGTVIGGNMRLRAFTELGWDKVWVSVTDATTDKDIFDLALTDNEEFGYYEQEQVAELALELGLSPLELKSYALSLGAPTTLDLVVDKFGPEPEEDEVPEVDEVGEPKSKLGEVYQLGRHRLMCGSATDQQCAEQLMDGDDPELVFTDPPYGVDVVKGGKVGADFGIAKKGNYNDVIGDDTTDTAQEFYELWSGFSERFIIWGGNYFTSFLPFSDGWLIWDKREDTGIRNTFADGEMAWVSFHTPVRIYRQLWNGMIRKGESGARVHPTQKPVDTLASIIKDFTEADDIVVDLFGGSGSTLIACEQTNRTCYMMELDPKYCDVIRKRYAKHIGEEESWQEVTPATNSLVNV